MGVTIKRVTQSKYELVGSDGDKIATYERTRMSHPSDWIEDAEAAGHSINGPFGWTFVDKRDSEA